VQPNKAIVGKNAFAHEAGIHQDGVLKNRLCYEIMTPQSVGVPETNIILGKHSGRHALKARYEKLGYRLSKEEVDQVYERFTQLADRKKNILDDDLIELLEHDADAAVAAFQLEHVELRVNGSACAAVKLRRQGVLLEGNGEAHDPVLACCAAVAHATNQPVSVHRYDISLHEATRLTRVEMDLHFAGEKYSGEAEANDVLSSATGACLRALNKYVRNHGAARAATAGD